MMSDKQALAVGYTLNPQQGEWRGRQQAGPPAGRPPNWEKQTCHVRNRELWSGRKICFPAPEGQAHRKLEGFSRKQPNGSQLLWGRQQPPPENNTTWFFVFLQH